MKTALPPPSVLGLPAKFLQWREDQEGALDAILKAPTRFVAIAAPTGAGKTLGYMAAAHLQASRTVVVTATKALQRQLRDDFSPLGLVLMQGSNEYDCLALQKGGEWVLLGDSGPHGCDQGPCHFGLPCSLREAGCTYYDQLRTATTARLVSTNYSYLLAQTRYATGLGKYDLLILDECVHAPDELASVMQIRYPKWLAKAVSVTPPWVPGATPGLPAWRSWGQFHADKLARQLDHLPTGKSQGELKHRRRLKQAEQTLRRLAQIDPTNWIEDHTSDAWVFEVLKPARWAEDLLFQGAKKVVLSSATMTPKTLALLGIDPGDVTWWSCPSRFPIERRWVTYVPTVRVDYRMAPGHVKQWVSRIDRYLDTRGDRKGLIHTVSYRRATDLYEQSEHKARMILNSAGDTAQAVAAFRHAPPETGRVLVSPSLTSGWDFPDCVAPDAAILTSDLRWVPAGTLQVGDKIAAFEEQKSTEGKGGGRRWQTATVLSTERVQRPCWLLGFSDGASVVCSDGHQWLVTHESAATGWVTTGRLRCDRTFKSRVAKIVPRWTATPTRNHGYLAAAFDGEGSLGQYQGHPSRGNAQTVTLAMSQVQNQMLQEVEALLETEGYGFSKHVKLWKNHPTHHQVGYTLNITRRWDILRFLGEVRPVRLLPKLQLERFGQIRAMPARLVSKIFLGPCEVVALETSTKTLVVEGYASHNSACRYQIVGKLPFPSTQSKIIQARAATDPDYIPYLMTQALQQMVGRGVRSETDWCETLICDDHYSWVRKKYASHFKDWFTEAVRWSDLLPKPMEF